MIILTFQDVMHQVLYIKCTIQIDHPAKMSRNVDSSRPFLPRCSEDHVSVSFILERARKAEDTKSVRRVLNH